MTTTQNTVTLNVCPLCGYTAYGPSSFVCFGSLDDRHPETDTIPTEFVPRQVAADLAEKVGAAHHGIVKAMSAASLGHADKAHTTLIAVEGIVGMALDSYNESAHSATEATRPNPMPSEPPPGFAISEKGDEAK